MYIYIYTLSVYIFIYIIHIYIYLSIPGLYYHIYIDISISLGYLPTDRPGSPGFAQAVDPPRTLEVDLDIEARMPVIQIEIQIDAVS